MVAASLSLITRSYSDGTGILFRGDSLMKGKKPLHIFKFMLNKYYM